MSMSCPIRQVKDMSATSVGQIGLDLVVNQKPFQKQMSGIQSLAKKAGAALVAAFAVDKIVKFGAECINLASDLQEVQNVVDVTFPNMTSQVDSFARSAASSFGLSETMAKKYTGTFGAMAKAFGFSEQQAYDMSTTLTGLAGDVASFYNITQDEAYTKLKSVFSGETETLKDLGVVMTQNALDAYALSNGYGKVTSKMTEAEKVALRYAFVQDQLSAAQGDFARTSDSWANQTRVLSLQFDQLKASIGSGLIAAFTPVLKIINTLLGRLQVLADAFANLMKGIFGDASGGGGMQQVADAAESAAASSGTMADNASATEASTKKTEKFLAGFDEITKASSSSSDSSSGSSGSGSGIAVGSGIIGAEVSSVEKASNGAIERIKKQFGGLLSYVQKKFAPAFQAVWKKFEKPLQGFAKNCGMVFSDIQGLAQPLWDYFDGYVVPFMQQFVLTAGTILAGLLDSFNRVFGDIWNVAIYPVVENLVTVVLPTLTDFSTQVLANFSTLFDEIKLLFDLLWSEGIAPVLELLTEVWIDFWNTVQEFWNKWGAPIFDNVRTAVKKTGDTFRNIWENIIGPVWDAFMDTVDDLWNNHLQPLVSNFLDLVGEFANGALEIYNRFILPIVNWFVNVLGPPISQVLSGIVSGFGSLIDTVLDVVNGVTTSLKGIIQFITGVFTGNWEKAFTGIKNIFKGVFDALVGIAKNPINAVINIINGLIRGVVAGINAVIKAINGISFKLPDWLGGYKVGFNLKKVTAPQIPLLAEGGYVQRNTPRLAVIGDNTRYGEIVAPENKMMEMALAAAEMAGGSNKEVVQLLRQLISLVQDGGDVVLMIGDEEIARASQNGSMKLKRRFITTDVVIG